MRSDTIKRHIKIHIEYKEKLDQNTKGVHLATFSNSILPAKDDKNIEEIHKKKTMKRTFVIMKMNKY